MLKNKFTRWFIPVLLIGTVLVAGCAPAPKVPGLTGTIEADGSSTVFPITEAVAEEFGKVHPGVRVNVGISGTGGGFKRFVVGETDIQNASRPITSKEIELAKKNGIEYIEFKIAYDGLSVVVNPKNDFVDYLTVAELKKIWEPGSKVKTWRDVRPHWPDKPLRLYSPGTDSGTFEYFTEVIVGKKKAQRADEIVTFSEDDYVLVRGVFGDHSALGYFGYAYYIMNRDKVKAVAIDAGKGPVLPSKETIEAGKYKPLSRALFIYVNKKSLLRPEVKAFVEFYMKNAAKLVPEVGYIKLDDKVYRDNLGKIK